MSTLRLKAVGFWQSSAEIEKSPISLHDRSKIIRYLDACPAARVRGTPFACVFQDQTHRATLERTDGVYVWPSGLVHYVRDHDVRLPECFVEHIRRQSYEYPRDFPSMFSFLVEYDNNLLVSWGLERSA